jgi:hypothetical protein
MGRATHNCIIKTKKKLMDLIITKLAQDLKNYFEDCGEETEAGVVAFIKKDGKYYAEDERYVTIDGMECKAKLRLEIVEVKF